MTTTQIPHIRRVLVALHMESLVESFGVDQVMALIRSMRKRDNVCSLPRAVSCVIWTSDLG